MSDDDLTSTATGKRTDYLPWDDYFMATAMLSAKRSKDPETQVGACIVDTKNRIVAIGYNGFPRNCNDDEFPWVKVKGARTSFNDKSMYVVHAEANAILNSNSTSLADTRLYTTLFPCNECAKLIIQSGIREVRYLTKKPGFKPIYEASKRMFDAVGIKYTHYSETRDDIVIQFL